MKTFPKIAATAITVTAVLSLAACSSSSKTSKASTSSGGATTTTAAAKKSGYAIGDTAKTGDFNVTVYAVKDPQPPTNDFEKPKPGNHFVSVDVQIANASSKAQAFSSLIGFHLLDAQNRSYDESIGAMKPSPPDGQIDTGQATRGFAVFEVPDGTTGLRFKVQGGLTATGAIFTL